MVECWSEILASDLMITRAPVALRYPRRVLLATAVVTVILGWQALGVQLDSSVESLLPEGHPAVLLDREIKEEFQSREMILIGVVSDEGVLRRATLAKVAQLTERIEDLDLAEPADARRFTKAAHRAGPPWDSIAREIVRGGFDRRDRAAVSEILAQVEASPDVDPAFADVVREMHHVLLPVGQVISLTNVDDLVGEGGGLRIRQLVPRPPADGEEEAALAERVFGNEMYVRGLVSPDTTGTAILVELSFHYDRYVALAQRLFDGLEGVVGPYRGPEDIRLAGVPMVNAYTSNFMGGDLAALLPLVSALVLVVMRVAFGSWRLALLPLGIVAVSLVWVVGVMATLGRPVTLVVSAMPVILVAVGVADGIHLVTTFQERLPGVGGRREAVAATLGALTQPIVFTSLTDMAGFGSLGVSSLASIRDFGLFTSLGVLAALALSLTALPACLVLLPVAARTGKPGPVRLPSRVFDGLADFAIRRRRWVSAGALVLAGLATLSLTQLRVGSTMVGYFHEDSEIYRASAMLNALFGGTEVMNVVVDTGRDDGLKDPATLQGIADLQDLLEADTLVGYTSSVADYVKRIHFVMNGERPAENRLPRVTEFVPADPFDSSGGAAAGGRGDVVAGRALVSQYLLLYEAAGGDDLDELVDFAYRKGNIVVQIRTDATPELRRIKDMASDFAEERFGAGTTVAFAGCSYLCVVADDLIIPGQLRSLAIALVVVLILLGLLFRSTALGFVGLAPLALTVLLVFAIMSVTGVHLDAVTALVASIVLGVGIDYSVHLVARYRASRQEGLEAPSAARAAIHATGRPIFLNSVAVALGFSVLLLSSFWPIMHIGWLVGATMVLGAALTLTLIPTLLAGRSDRGPGAPGPEEPS